MRGKVTFSPAFFKSVFAVVFFTFARLAREHWVGNPVVYTPNHYLMLIVQLLRARVVSMRFGRFSHIDEHCAFVPLGAVGACERLQWGSLAVQH